MLRGKHKLMREGAQGHAEVLREQRRGAGTRDWRQYIDARFQCPDGSFVEFSGHVLQTDIGSDFFDVGDVVPVRYDPMDHRQIVLDIPMLKAQRDARRAGRQPLPPAVSARPEQPSGPDTPRQGLTSCEVAVALEQMANLGELRHSALLTDSEYEAEKLKFQELMTRRTSATITEAEFEAENALRLAGLPSSSQRVSA